jgi:hypothetical protein
MDYVYSTVQLPHLMNYLGKGLSFYLHASTNRWVMATFKTWSVRIVGSEGKNAMFNQQKPPRRQKGERWHVLHDLLVLYHTILSSERSFVKQVGLGLKLFSVCQGWCISKCSQTSVWHSSWGDAGNRLTCMDFAPGHCWAPILLLTLRCWATVDESPKFSEWRYFICKMNIILTPQGNCGH